MTPHTQSSSHPTTPLTLKARSISQVIVTFVGDVPFHGRVLSCFPAACNLADETNRVVSLVTPQVGNGPLNVVVEGQDPFTGIFAGIEPGSRVRIDSHGAMVGHRLAVSFKNAVPWNPTVSWQEISAAAMASLWNHVQEQAMPENLLTFWVPTARPLGGVRMAFQETARDAAERLLLALRRGDQASIALHASALAGLGPGATPAGDDFLVGLMAGLRAWPQFLALGSLLVDDACTSIGRAAMDRTHVFSAAHLQAAQAGLLGIRWHHLAAALASGDETAVRQAADDVLAFGATSGADAMAGFVGPYLLAPASETVPYNSS